MNHYVLFAAGDLVELAKSTGEQFGFQTQLFVSQVISFCIVAFLLHRFAYKPILKVLEERRQKIADGLHNAEKIKLKLAEAEAEKQRILNDANAQATKLIEDARTAAGRERDRLMADAKREADAEREKGRREADAERGRVMTEARREVGRLVVATTAKVTGKVLTPDDQRRLAEEATRQVAA